MGTFFTDLRHALRLPARNPGFAAAAILTLALGIGANTAVFSVVNGVLLRGLPYQDSDRLVMFWERSQREGKPRTDVAPANYRDVRDGVDVFEGLAVIFPYTTTNMTGQAEPERLPLLRVSGNMFDVLGVRAAIGRTLTPADDQLGAPGVVVISDGLWRRRFGADSAIVGRPVRLSDSLYTVVGVMPPGFRLPVFAGDIYAPLALDESTAALRAVHFLWPVGRLRPGVTLDQAQRQLETVASRLEREFTETNTGVGFTASTLTAAIAGGVQPVLRALFGAVVLVLLIACANIANLHLVRASSRVREMAVRTALGASRFRVARQLLAESFVLTALGGLGAALLASWAVTALRALAPAGLPRIEDIAVDGPVLLFTTTVAILAGLLSGVIPAFAATRTEIGEALKEGGRGNTASRQRNRWRGVLVVSQVTVAVVLVIGAGLVVRSFERVMAVDPGFNADRVLTLGLQPGGAYGDPVRRIQFYDQILERVAALSGVTAAGAINTLPMTVPGATSWAFVEHHPPAPGTPPQANYRVVSMDYFKAMGTPVMAGRSFTREDRVNRALPIIVNETFVRRLLPGENAIGQRIRLGPNPNAAWREIVGVVGDVHDAGPDSLPNAEVYAQHAQAPPNGVTLAIRTSGDPRALIAPVRAALRELDADLPIYNVATLEDVAAAAVSRQRFSLALFGVFAALALALAAVGTYGVLAFSVSQRTHEFGVRLTLGAARQNMLRLVIGQGLRLGALGVALGLGLALVATRSLTDLLFEVRHTDPLTYAAAILVIGGSVLVASYVPARRATQVDPMVALRHE